MLINKKKSSKILEKLKTWRNFENFIENVVSFQDKFENFNKNSEKSTKI